MELVTPDIGLAVWTLLAFLILLFLLTKFAWKPILTAVNDREQSISDALESAERAKMEMSELVADNERILQEARSERESLLKEAREMRDQIIADAKSQAKEEASRLMENAKESITHEKMAAITDIKNQVADLSIEIAESLLRRELGDDAKQKDFIDSVIREIEQN